MIPVTLGQFLPALPEGGRSSLTATVVRGMAMTIQLARFTVDDDAVPALMAGRPAMVRALAGPVPRLPGRVPDPRGRRKLARYRALELGPAGSAIV
jgi:hypothetical protein